MRINRIKGRRIGPICALGLALIACSPSPELHAVENTQGKRSEVRHKTITSTPKFAPRVVVGQDPMSGVDIEVACSTCHSTREPDIQNGLSKSPSSFHQKLIFEHGSLACLSCHNAEQYDQLRLANGSALDFQDSMQLCAQCHAKRHIDYQHGAHGGMNGYWDQSRGERTRKHCIDCHNPHFPSFPQMRPTFKPIDRFLDPIDEHSTAEGGTASHD